jgi:hypothetical protein
MRVHVQVVGGIYIAFAAIALLGAIVLFVGTGSVVGIVGASGDPDAAAAIPIIANAGTAVMAMALLMAVPGLATGIGLLYFKPWARILGVILSAINLLGFPILTIFGAYALWVLLSKDSEHLFTLAPPVR